MTAPKIAHDIEWKYFSVSHDYGSGEWYGSTPMKSYSIYDVSEKYPTDNRYYVRELSDQFETLEQAQDACQDHFNTTVKLCIDHAVYNKIASLLEKPEPPAVAEIDWSKPLEVWFGASGPAVVWQTEDDCKWLEIHSGRFMFNNDGTQVGGIMRVRNVT